jgi:Holliday junction resolvase RusA-like endonuclease
MKSVKLLITGNPAIKKNSRTIAYNRRTGRMYPVKSANLEAAENLACWELQEQWKRPAITTPVSVKFLFYRGDKRRVDLSNLYEFAQDALQAAGILADDFLIESHDGSRRLYDKENPRTEITIDLYKTPKQH